MKGVRQVKAYRLTAGDTIWLPSGGIKEIDTIDTLDTERWLLKIVFIDKSIYHVMRNQTVSKIPFYSQKSNH